jgi:pimeloyl-ACP methyl ester carboxylesterase
MSLPEPQLALQSAAFANADDQPRLVAQDGSRRHLSGVAGKMLARPWLDSVTLASLKHVYFPLSRLWAAASVAEGSVDTFWEASNAPRRHEQRESVQKILPRFEEANVTATATDAAWHKVFFGAAETSVATRVALETARHTHRHALNLTRFKFWPLLSRHTPRVRLAIATPDEVLAAYDHTRDTDEHFAPPTVMPVVQVSHPVPGVNSTDLWLSFKSPSARIGDTVFARVHTPLGVKNPPTVILGHGVCVEFDHWHGLIDETQALVARGIRVIRPEAPWHGRRSPAGYYGGERAIGAFPLGMVDLMVAAVQEWSVLIDWARRTSTGPVGIAGTSLGALTAQLAASVAHDWPDHLKPEALYLITHSGSMSEGMLTGATASLFASPVHAAKKGWTLDLARRHLSMIDPVRPPVMPPARVVSVLGNRDVITPFQGGETLVWRWNVPSENIFVSDNGHFTIPMRLIRMTEPTERFASILKSL